MKYPTPEPWMRDEWRRKRAERNRVTLSNNIGRLTFVVLLALLIWIITPPAEAQGFTIAGKGVDNQITLTATVTAYTSSEGETDSTPFENASGTRPERGSIACPRSLAFGTRVAIEGETYVCDDRMHSRFADRFDVWVESKEQAFEWGKRHVAVEIL